MTARERWDETRALIEAGWHSGWGEVICHKPTPTEIDAAQTVAGGWTRETLAAWGVPWPPQKGWRQRLTTDWEDTKQAQHDGSRQIYGGLGTAQRED